LKLLRENFEKDKQTLLLKSEKEQQMNVKNEKLRELMHFSHCDTRWSNSALDNSTLPSKVQPIQIFQSIAASQNQGDLQAAKKPRLTTPNLSRKMHVNSIQISVVNPVKNHILKHSNDDDLHDFVPESGASPWRKNHHLGIR
jgi:hypothetical protein